MNRADFAVKVEFTDGTLVDIGGGDELFISPGEGSESATLNDERLNLIRLLRDAENEACDA